MLKIEYQFSHECIRYQGFYPFDNGVMNTNNFFIVPISIGSGHSYFTQVQPGLSAFYVDQIFNEDLEVTRKASENDVLIFELNLAQSTTDAIDSVIRFRSNDRKELRLIKKGTRLHSLFLFIDRDTTVKSIPKDIVIAKLSIFIYNRLLGNENFIDVLKAEFEKRNIFDFSFKLYVTGISLKIYAVMVTAFFEYFDDEKSDIDAELLAKSKDYLLTHLNEKFPTLPFLARMCGFSVSKYRFLFKKIYNETPYDFFIRNKYNLATEMLKSGTFDSVSEVAESLNYNKVYHFYSKYFKLHGRTVYEDFVQKEY